ncbi:MAG TPA: type II secretion system F family protein [Acidimicrobiia bacterium]|jgi:tight adherence protein B|nr:type II secretion system F family protein [Acidimicrobiia bacterium]
MIFVIVILAALATAGLVGSVGVLLGRREAALERRLAGYERIDPAEAAKESGPETAVVQQAVEYANRLASNVGVLQKVEQALERADLPVRAGELLFYSAAAVVMVFLGITVLSGVTYGLIAALLVGVAPAIYVSRKQRARQHAFERQLPDTLTLLASSLRAGFSFMQGLEAVAQEIGPPMRRELQRVFTEVRLGRSPEDALDDAAVRMGSNDLAWTVMAIKIQREVGGNLATLLDTVADTMQKRERIRAEIRALTAEGRLSGIILGLLPPVAGVLLFLVAPEYMKTLFNEALGIAAVIAAGGLAIVGWFWLRKIVDIEV